MSACHQCKLSGAYIFEDFRTGDHVCSKCGHCSGAIVSSQRDWRSFADSNAPDPNRVGQELDSTLSTSSMEIMQSGSRAFKRRKRTSTEASDNRQRRVNREIRAACDLLNLPKRAVENAKMMSLRMKQARIIAPVVAASVKMACREIGIARNMNEICWAVRLPNCKAAWKCHVAMAAKATKPKQHTNTDTAAGSKQPYVETPKGETFMAASEREAAMHGRLAANRLQLPYALGSAVERVIIAAKAKGILDGTRPTSIAAAAAWLIASNNGISMSKKQAASLLGLSEGALRRSANALEPLAANELQPKIEPKEEPIR